MLKHYMLTAGAALKAAGFTNYRVDMRFGGRSYTLCSNWDVLDDVSRVLGSSEDLDKRLDILYAYLSEVFDDVSIRAGTPKQDLYAKRNKR